MTAHCPIMFHTSLYSAGPRYFCVSCPEYRRSHEEPQHHTWSCTAYNTIYCYHQWLTSGKWSIAQLWPGCEFSCFPHYADTIHLLGLVLYKTTARTTSIFLAKKFVLFSTNATDVAKNIGYNEVWPYSSSNNKNKLRHTYM